MRNLLACIIFFFIWNNSIGQNCGTCSIVISTNDTSSYTVGSGVTLCIDTLGNFTGNITLSGGTVCNKGLFNPSQVTFNSGAINNFSNSTINTNIILTSGKFLTNQPGGIMGIGGSITVGGGDLGNDGILNITLGVSNNSGTLINTGIMNCQQLTGSNAVNNTGIINTN